MKKILLINSFLLLSLFSFSQTWQDMGGFASVPDAQNSEIEVLSNGNVVWAYRESAGTLKINKWVGNAWFSIPSPVGDPISEIRLTSVGDVIYLGFQNEGLSQYQVYKYEASAWTLLGDLSFAIHPANLIDIDATEMSVDQVNLIFYTDAISNAEFYQWDGGSWVYLSADFLSYTAGPLMGAKFDLEDNNSETFLGVHEYDDGVGDLRFYKFDGASWNNFFHMGDPFLTQGPLAFATDATVGMNPFVAYVSPLDPNKLHLVEADMGSAELIDLPSYDAGMEINAVGLGMTVNTDNHVIVSLQTTDTKTRVIKFDGTAWTEIIPPMSDLTMAEYDLNVFKASGKPYFTYRTGAGELGVKAYNKAPSYITSSSPISVCEGSTSALSISNIQFNDQDHDSVYLSFNVLSGSLLVSEIDYNRTIVYSPFSSENTFEILLSPTTSGTSLVEIIANDGLNSTVYTETFVVNAAPSGATASIVSNPTTCESADGVINISGLTASTPFAVNYTDNGVFFDAGVLTSSASGGIDLNALDAGMYNDFNITNDISGCGTTLSTPLILTDPLAPAFSIYTTNALYCNDDGTLNLSGLSSSTTYDQVTYDYNGFPNTLSSVTTDGAGDLLVATLPAGIITNVTVTKAGCVGTASGSYIITEPAPPVISLSTTAATCGIENGAVDATISGGASPYNIYWSNGEITEDISDVSATTYYINVTDANDCYAMAVATVQVSTLSIDVITTNVSCNGGNNGAIILDPVGTGPFTYYWSNGATTQEIGSLTAGQYEVFVTDDLGCMSTASYILTEPLALNASFTVTPATCGVSNGGILSSISGGTGPYDLVWKDETGATVGTAGTLTGVPAGAFSLEITDFNSCSKTFYAEVSNVGAPSVSIQSITPSSCSGDGAIDISASSLTSFVTGFEWSTGETTEDLSGKPAGYYTVTVTDNASCRAVKGMTVTNVLPEVQEICIVTVDQTTNTNRVVWEKAVSTEIDHYNIYRESSIAGMFQFVSEQDYSTESFFVDPIAYPQLRSWRYKITAVNNCGVESMHSVEHKTIHVVYHETSTGVYQLNWDAYEGFIYPDYVIWRFTTAAGWEEVTTQSSSAPTEYTDTPATTEGIDYMIEIIPPSSCVSTGKATDHNSSRSNKTSSISAPPGGGGSDLGTVELDGTQVSVYPNPTDNWFTVQINGELSVIALNVYDLSGKLIFSIAENKGNYLIDLSNYEPSIYVMELITESGSYIQKVVKH